MLNEVEHRIENEMKPKMHEKFLQLLTTHYPEINTQDEMASIYSQCKEIIVSKAMALHAFYEHSLEKYKCYIQTKREKNEPLYQPNEPLKFKKRPREPVLRKTPTPPDYHWHPNPNYKTTPYPNRLRDLKKASQESPTREETKEGKIINKEKQETKISRNQETSTPELECKKKEDRKNSNGQPDISNDTQPIDQRDSKRRRSPIIAIREIHFKHKNHINLLPFSLF